MRWLLALAAAFLLSGCGAATLGPAGAPVVADRPAPPIEAADEAPPDDVAAFLSEEFTLDISSGGSSDSTLSVEVCGIMELNGSEPVQVENGVGTACPQRTAEQQAQFDEELRRYTEAIRPAPGTEPRGVAKLRLSGRELLFTTWASTSGGLCWETDLSGPDGSGGDGPAGPCELAARALAYPDSGVGITAPCASVCLDSQPANLDDGTDTNILSATVPLDAEAIRITLAGGGVATYPLVGPVVPRSSRRVFLLDLGARDWRKLELVRNAAVATTVEMPALRVAYEDCSDTVGPVPLPPD
jgi:hypothetical protein